MLTEDYVVGLTDGEGSFQVQNRKDRKNPAIRFSIKLREKDKHILEEIKSFFDCGNVYVQNDKRPNHSRCYRFEVAHKKDMVEKIIPFFENNPPRIKSKVNDFELLKQVVLELSKDDPNYKLINLLIKQMH
jgi:hypothetical protein